MLFCSSGTATSRRRLLRLGIQAGAALAVGGMPVAALARGLARRHPERALWLYNLHTDEEVHSVYWAEGRYLPEGLAEISYCLRDRRSGEVTAASDPRGIGSSVLNPPSSSDSRP